MEPDVLMNTVEEPELEAESTYDLDPLQFRGAFGLRGGLRDVIGLLGDAFLAQAGRAPIYGPQRQAEEEANAMQGFFTGSPARQRRDLQQLSDLGNPELAGKFYDRMEANDIKRMNAQSIADYRKAQNEERTWKIMEMRQKIADKYPAYFTTVTDEASFQRARQQAIYTMDRLGIPQEMRPLIPERYDREWVRNVGMTPEQRRKVEALEKRASRRPTPARERMVQTIDPRTGKRVWTPSSKAAGQEAPAPAGRGSTAIAPPTALPPGYTRMGNGDIRTPSGAIIPKRPQ